jgi:hypothetical protein
LPVYVAQAALIHVNERHPADPTAGQRLHDPRADAPQPDDADPRPANPREPLDPIETADRPKTCFVVRHLKRMFQYQHKNLRQKNPKWERKIKNQGKSEWHIFVENFNKNIHCLISLD